jgi:hypothetical protein
VALPREVAFAFIVDDGSVTAPDDVGGVDKLDVGRAVPQAVDPEVGEGDKVVVGLIDGKDGMSDLLDNDRAGCR